MRLVNSRVRRAHDRGAERGHDRRDSERARRARARLADQVCRARAAPRRRTRPRRVDALGERGQRGRAERQQRALHERLEHRRRLGAVVVTRAERRERLERDAEDDERAPAKGRAIRGVVLVGAARALQERRELRRKLVPPAVRQVGRHHLVQRLAQRALHARPTRAARWRSTASSTPRRSAARSAVSPIALVYCLRMRFLR